MANFELAIKHTLQYEGGYVNDPVDKNGKTYMGISFGAHPNWEGWKIVDKKPRKKNEMIPELDTMVCNFYKRYYWDAIQLDKVCNDKVAGFIFDWYVNSGRIAIKHVQRIVDVEDDGVVGKDTIAAINNYEGGLFNNLITARTMFVKNIVKANPSQDKFLKGWLNRINSFK